MNKVEKNQKNICIIGLGFVGLTVALSLAKKGFNIVGVEKNKSIIKLLQSGKSHFYEPGIQNLLKKMIKNKKIIFLSMIPKIINLNTFIITVGTPIDKNKKIITQHIENVAKELTLVLKNDDLVILRSTVGVGVTRKIVLPILQSKAKKIYLSFCPERTLEGKAMQELMYLPQIIGGLDKVSILKSSQIFQKLTKKIIQVSSIETAELIKLVDNSNRDVFFAYANEIAKICDGYGVSAAEVIRKGKKNYPRTNLPSPGLVGGPCLEKDPHIMSQSSIIQNNIFPNITIQARKLNENLPIQIIKYIKQFLIRNKFKITNLNILLAGIAFKGKPITTDTRGTVAKIIVKEIKKKFRKPNIFGYDPMVKNSDIENLLMKPVNNFYNSINKMDLIIILNNNPFFQKLKLTKFYKCEKLILIYDFWSNISSSSKEFKKNKYYISLGNHQKFRIND
jgi:UDP-N-acetyl-D-mannosaminuronic acid dehydrogenase